MKQGHHTGEIATGAADSRKKSGVVTMKQCEVEGNRWLEGLKRYFLPPAGGSWANYHQLHVKEWNSNEKAPSAGGLYSTF